MSVAELQQKLIEEISKTNDVVLLEDMYSFIKIDQEVEETYILTPEQKAQVEKAREQVKNGHFFTNEEVNAEMDIWLGK